MVIQSESGSGGYGRVALVLQGGGALGAYQVGVYAALEEAGYRPGWIAGTSIGAINGAIIAGNPPARVLDRLTTFWQRVAQPDVWPRGHAGGAWDRAARSASAMHSVLYGRPGFFSPRPVSPLLHPSGGPGAESYYDTRPLRDTLESLVDFDRINDGPGRLSLGAVNVLTGKTVYFDSARRRIGPEHVMASGALPPAFPPVEADGALYWDGGIVSNTPLDAVLREVPQVDTLCFAVDLFDPAGPRPASIEEVEERRKDIMYASRTERHIEAFRDIHHLRHAVHLLRARLPEELRDDPDIAALDSMGSDHVINVVRLLYEEREFQLPAKDYEFSNASLRRHREQGYRQTRRLLAGREWLEKPSAKCGISLREPAHRGPRGLPAARRRPGTAGATRHPPRATTSSDTVSKTGTGKE